MRLRILNENDNNDNIQEETTNFSEEQIRNKSNGFLTTIVDYVNKYLFGGELLTINEVSRNTNLSDEMSNIFTDTRVNVWIYQSKVLNAFTIPGISVDSSLLVRIGTIFPKFITQGLGIFILTIIALFYMMNKCVNILQSGFSSTQKLIYDPATGKYTMQIKEVTLFISSGLVEALNDNEIKAILLHEVGHNTMIIADILSSILHTSFMGISVMTLIRSFHDMFIEGLKNREIINPIDKVKPGLLFPGVIKGGLLSNRVYIIYYTLFQFFLVYICVSFVVNYFRRRQEVYADEFAIKCGYGQYLESATTKMKQHTHNLIGKPVIKLNFLDMILLQIQRYWSVIYNLIGKFKLNEYPNINDRIAAIHRKTEKFNNGFNQNIDRTKHIETFVV